MRKSIMLVGAVLLAGCGGFRPVSVSAPATGLQTMDCVREEMEERGYRVVYTNPTTTATGVRINEQPWYKDVLGFEDTADRLTALHEAGELQVTAVSSDPTEASMGGPALEGDGATQEAGRHARQIVAECANAG